MSNIVSNEKREVIIYVTIFLWIIFGIASPLYNVSFADISIYFVSLTGFISAYIWGESVRKAKETSIFTSGASSTREKMMYLTMVLWILLGTYGFFRHLDFVNLAAYFSVLTPFVGAYILGRTYKPNVENDPNITPEIPIEPTVEPLTDQSTTT